MPDTDQEAAEQLMNPDEPAVWTYGALFNAVKRVVQGIGIARDSKALDVPAGGGALTKFLVEEMGLETIASDIDVSKWQYQKIPLVWADLGKRLPLSDGAFDLVVCLEGLKHVSDVSTAVSELARVTKPGCHLIITIPNDLAMQTRLRFIFDGFVDADRKTVQIPGSKDDREFTYVMSIVQLPYLYYILKKNNLEIVRCSTSRYRAWSVIFAVAAYPLIWLMAKRACGPFHALFREMTSMTWLAGRHNIILLKKCG